MTCYYFLLPALLFSLCLRTHRAPLLFLILSGLSVICFLLAGLVQGVTLQELMLPLLALLCLSQIRCKGGRET